MNQGKWAVPSRAYILAFVHLPFDFMAETTSISQRNLQTPEHAQGSSPRSDQAYGRRKFASFCLIKSRSQRWLPVRNPLRMNQICLSGRGAEHEAGSGVEIDGAQILPLLANPLFNTLTETERIAERMTLAATGDLGCFIAASRLMIHAMTNPRVCPQRRINDPFWLYCVGLQGRYQCWEEWPPSQAWIWIQWRYVWLSVLWRVLNCWCLWNC